MRRPISAGRRLASAPHPERPRRARTLLIRGVGPPSPSPTCPRRRRRPILPTAAAEMGIVAGGESQSKKRPAVALCSVGSDVEGGQQRRQCIGRWDDQMVRDRR